MTKFLSFFLLFTSISTTAHLKNDLDSVTSLIRSDIEQAKILLLELKAKNDLSNDLYWLTKSNYLLGYIYKEQSEFGKATIHYLEAIRYAKKSNYSGVESDLISLHNRCAIIFKQFKAYDLAADYYRKGSDLAIKAGDSLQLILLNYNNASLLRDTDKHQEAISILSECLPLVKKGSTTYFEYLNRLAVTHFDINSYDEAISIQQKIIAEIPDSKNKLLSYSYHNLARAYRAIQNYQKAEEFYLKAIYLKKNNDLFSSLYGYAELLIENGNIERSIEYFNQANEFVDRNDPESFEIYKDQANLYYSISKYNQSKYYEDLYSLSLNNYLKIQQQLQETDKQINLDLITKRYFDEVAKQEKIASILFYSRLTSGSLLFLLLAVIGYNRFDKVRVRRTIEEQLIKLEMMD